MCTLKPQNNGPVLHSNTVIGTLAVDGWAVTFGTATRSPPNNGQCIPTSYYSMWHYNCLCTLRGLKQLQPVGLFHVQLTVTAHGLVYYNHCDSTQNIYTLQQCEIEVKTINF